MADDMLPLFFENKSRTHFFTARKGKKKKKLTVLVITENGNMLILKKLEQSSFHVTKQTSEWLDFEYTWL